MKLRIFSAFAMLAALALSPAAQGAPNDEEVAAHQLALDVAGAFQNDGFKLRDGVWAGRLEKGKTAVIQVNLFAGNEYWFVLGAVSPAKKVSVTVFDETGKVVECEPYQQDATAAAGFSPGVSGPYYVKVTLEEGDPATFCMLYSYK
jgi:hypothetical protein